jgi:hypothetical protein
MTTQTIEQILSEITLKVVSRERIKYKRVETRLFLTHKKKQLHVDYSAGSHIVARGVLDALKAQKGLTPETYKGTWIYRGMLNTQELDRFSKGAKDLMAAESYEEATKHWTPSVRSVVECLVSDATTVDGITPDEQGIEDWANDFGLEGYAKINKAWRSCQAHARFIRDVFSNHTLEDLKEYFDDDQSPKTGNDLLERQSEDQTAS